MIIEYDGFDEPKSYDLTAEQFAKFFELSKNKDKEQIHSFFSKLEEAKEKGQELKESLAMTELSIVKPYLVEESSKEIEDKLKPI